jgi:hypothetical protein
MERSCEEGRDSRGLGTNQEVSMRLRLILAAFLALGAVAGIANVSMHPAQASCTDSNCD